MNNIEIPVKDCYSLGAVGPNLADSIVSMLSERGSRPGGLET